MERIGEWFPFSQNLFLRKVVQYELGDTDWERAGPLNAASHCAVAPCGGPVALAKTSAAGGSTVTVFTSSGTLMKEFICPPEHGSVVSCGWTKEESLLAVTSKYVVLIYELCSLPSGGASTLCAASTVIKLAPHQKPGSTTLCCDIKSTGLCIVTMETGGNACLETILIEDRKDPQHVSMKLERPSALWKACSPACAEVLPHDITEEGESIFYIGTTADKKTKTGTIVVAKPDDDSITDAKARVLGGVVAVKLSPDAKTIAVLSSSGGIFTFPPDLSSAVRVLTLGVKVVPVSVQWCGSRFLFLTYNEASFDEYDGLAEDFGMFSIAVPIGVKAEVKFEKISWTDDGCGWCTVTQEVDGVRVITDSSSVFVEDVPESIVSLCQLKPTSAVGLFAKAFNQMRTAGDVAGLTAIRDLVQKLGTSAFEAQVVDLLLDAASCEQDVAQQERILAVAADAKNRVKNFDTDKYVDVIKRLRIVNAVRDPKCGAPISMRQYEYLSGADHLRALTPSETQVLLDRIVNRRNFQLALDISTTLKLKSQKILVQWASSLVQNRTLEDAKIAAMITSVLSKQPGATYIEAARMASSMGRKTLAIHLLQNEPRAQQQVLLLLQMGQEDLALQKAFESDEVDLIAMVLVKLLSQRSDQQIFNAFGSSAAAQCWLVYGSQEIRSWRTLLYKYWADAQKKHLEGFHQLIRKIRNDRDAHIDKWMKKGNVAQVSDNVEAKTVDDDDDAGVASDEEKLYNDLDDLRLRSDDDEPVEEKKKKKSSLFGIFKSKKDDNTEKKASSVKKSQAGAAAAEASPSSCEVLLPRKHRVAGSPEFTTDDVIDIAKCFPPSGPAELEGRWCRLHLTLMEEQKRLADDTGEDRFINQSILRTIEMCIEHDKDLAADNLRVKYNINDKKYCFAKLRALCAARRWADVDKMFGVSAGVKAKNYKSPIGFLPIVEVLYRCDRMQQAAQYVPRLAEICHRVEWYVKLDCFQAAIDDAYNEESPELIQQILKKANNPTIIEYGQKKMKDLQ